MTDFEEISRRAEQDLNSYQAKTGEARRFGVDDAGANTYQAEKFPGAEVTQDDDLSTNRGFDKRIPPSEGGTTDDRGRETRGHHFEGHGGPIDKINDSYREQGGQNDNDVVPARVPNVGGLGGANDIATQGQNASRANVGNKPPGPGGSQYKGSDYYEPESVPDSISAEGNIAPNSTIQASREAENPDEFR